MLHCDNFYRIFARVKNWRCGYCGNKVSGSLLYDKTVKKIQQGEAYHMHVSKASVKTQNLNLRLEEITEQLDEIAKEHVETRKVKKYF